MISRGETTFELTAGWSKFEELYSQYPDARFILNTRNQERWIKSISKHFKRRKKSDSNFQVANYITIRTSAKRRHEDRIRTFFEMNPQARFLEVDIEAPDAGIKIIRFLDEDTSHSANWSHLGRSSLFQFRQIKKKFNKLRKNHLGGTP